MAAAQRTVACAWLTAAVRPHLTAVFWFCGETAAQSAALKAPSQKPTAVLWSCPQSSPAWSSRDRDVRLTCSPAYLSLLLGSVTFHRLTFVSLGLKFNQHGHVACQSPAFFSALSRHAWLATMPRIREERIREVDHLAAGMCATAVVLP